MSTKDVPTVAKRNDPASLEPYAKSQATKAENVPPGWVAHWFREDQLEEKCRPHEIGNERTGFLMVAGWQLCTKNDGIVTGRGPAAGGTSTDTTVRKGDLVLCKIPKEEHDKYAVIERANDELVNKRLTVGEKHNFGSNTTFRTRTVGGRDGLDASTSDILGAA
jgi:hypothetical protein